MKRIGIWLVGLILLTSIGCGWLNEASDVAGKEFGPKEMLRKYEWFKDTAASLEAKKATIRTFEAELKATIDSYGGDMTKMPRDVRNDIAQKRSEIAGTKAAYNNLAAEYNAQMAKFNWRFTNAGDLPEGADEPLPREFKEYETQ